MKQLPPKKEVFDSIQSLARELDVSEKTVWRWIKKDELKAHKLGSQWRISPEDREIFLKLRRK
jgi:excisionase family DNA binding protein